MAAAVEENIRWFEVWHNEAILKFWLIRSNNLGSVACLARNKSYSKSQSLLQLIIRTYHANWELLTACLVTGLVNRRLNPRALAFLSRQEA
jgi:hypothetical protein